MRVSLTDVLRGHPGDKEPSDLGYPGAIGLSVDHLGGI
jgi:hypothetical protein